MPPDSLEVFKKVIFGLPELRTTLTAYLVLGLVYSTLIFFIIDNLFIELRGLLFIPALAFLLFIVPGIISSELYRFLLPEYPRSWGYFLTTVNQLIIFLFTVAIAFSDNVITAWRVVWIGLTTLYLNNFFILVLSIGPDKMKRISLLGLIQPLLILGGFHLTLGTYLQIGFMAYLSNFFVIIGAGLVLLMAIYLTEFLVGSNVSDISIMHLASALLQNKQEKLDLGRPVKPDVQTLKIGNSSGEKTIVAPWIHPGPLEGFGGGRMTDHIVKELNEGRNEGFFLHVPSCHEMDPSDPSDSQKVLDAISESEKTGKASKMFEKEYEFCTMYGRRVGDQNVIFMDIEGYDDYESSIFEEIIDKNETLLIDLHNQPKGSRGEEMRYGTVDAETVRENILDFQQELEKLSQHEYKAGFSVVNNSKPVSALVEYVGGQKTVLFGIEGNDASKILLDQREKFEQSFDRALLFTTDTHASIHDLASEKQVEPGIVDQAVEEALADLSEAEIGFSSSEAERMKFLKDDYYGLIYTINILVRLIPIALVVLYISLIIWML